MSHHLVKPSAGGGDDGGVFDATGAKPVSPALRAGTGALSAVAIAGVVLWQFQAVAPARTAALIAATAAWLIIFTVACVGAGTLVTAPWTGRRRRNHDVGSLSITALLGAGALMAWAFAAALLGVMSTPVLGAGLAAAAVAGAVVLAVGHRLPAAARTRGVRFQVDPAIAGLLLPAIAVGLWTFALLPALSPQYDPLNYHLAMPFQWLREGSLVVFPRHAYSFLPANMGLLYAYALALGGPLAAQAVNWWMAAVTATLVGALARRLGGAAAAAPWAVAVLVTSPALIRTGTIAAADTGTAAFAAAAWLVVVRHRSSRRAGEPGGAVAAGILAGLALGCKLLTGLTVVIPLAGALAVTGGYRNRRRRLSVPLFFGAGCVAAFAPWLIRSTVLTGDPLYPYLTPVLHRLGLVSAGATAAARAAAHGMGALAAGAPSLRVLLTLGTFHPRSFAGVIGPLFLICLPLVAWTACSRGRFGRRAATPLVGVVVGVLGWALAPPLGRYLLPVLALVAALAGATLARLVARCSPVLRTAVVLLVVFVGLWNLSAAVDRTVLERVAVVLGETTEQNFLDATVSYWPAVDFINRELPAGARVLLVAEGRTFGIRRNVVPEDPFRRPLLGELAERAKDSGEIAAALRRMGVTHVLYNRTEARRIALMTGRASYFSGVAADAAGRLEAFRRSFLEPVYQSGGVAVFRLARISHRRVK